MVNIFGYILDIANAPIKGASVTSVVLPTPSAALWFPSYTVKTDVNGYFSLSLAENIAVDIYIPSLNFRRTLLVPNTSTNLFDIP